jgi:hypothetical protein
MREQSGLTLGQRLMSRDFLPAERDEIANDSRSVVLAIDQTED